MYEVSDKEIKARFGEGWSNCRVVIHGNGVFRYTDAKGWLHMGWRDEIAADILAADDEANRTDPDYHKRG